MEDQPHPKRQKLSDGVQRGPPTPTVSGASSDATPQHSDASSLGSGHTAVPVPDDPPLQGTVIYLHPSIPHLGARKDALRRRLTALGAVVARSLAPNQTPPVTHAVVGVDYKLLPSSADAPVSGAADVSKPGGTRHATSKATSGHKPAVGSSRLSSGAAAGKRISGGGTGRLSGAASRAAKGAVADAPAPDYNSTEALSVLARSWREAAKRGEKAPVIVRSDWLEAVLACDCHMQERGYEVLPPDDEEEEAMTDGVGSGAMAARMPKQLVPAHEPAPGAPMACFADWLGWWEPYLNSITSQVEFVLQGRFSTALSTKIGNEGVVQALRELNKFEEAVSGGRLGRSVQDGPPTGISNHEALAYARAAASVRGCQFRLRPSHSPKDLHKAIPYVGMHIANVIHEVLTTGTCEQLEDFRADRPVRNSRGIVRPGTEGGATRRMFVKLPGVGPGQAVQWWNAGCRSFEDVEAAAAASANRPGGDVSLTQRGSLAADSRGMEARSRGAAAPAGPDLDAEAGGDDTFEAVSFEGPPGMEEPGYASDTSGSRRTVVVPRQIRYCLKHRSDLLEDVASSELAEMRSVVLEGLEAVSGAPGPWRIEQVGGGRRTQQAHDADWLVTHPVAGVEGVALRLYEWLVAKGRVVSQKDGFCVMQHGNMPGYAERAKADFWGAHWGTKHQMDRYDHLFCLWITPEGKRRRVDVIVVPHTHWPWALMGWTGSRQYLRWVRMHAGECGMVLNSHFMLRRLGNAVAMVPDEAPPLNSRGREFWPPGWECNATDQQGQEQQQKQAGQPEGNAPEAQDKQPPPLQQQQQVVVRPARRLVETERDIFELLRVPYREPGERDCF